MKTPSGGTRWYGKAVIGGVVAWLAAVAPVGAQWFENFDTYANGSQIHGQGGWQGWDNSAAAGALVSRAASFSAPHSIAITGASDLVHRYSGYSSGVWVYSVRQYIPASVTTGTSYFILLNTYNDRGPYDWSVQTAFNLQAGTVSEEMAVGYSVPIVRNKWVELKYLIDLTAGTVTCSYNGTVFSTHPWHDITGVNSLAAVDLFANSTGPVYYDNLYIVPADSYVASVLAAGPVAYWRLNEANSTFTAFDCVGGYNATHNASVVSGVTGPRPPTFPKLEASNTGAAYDGVSAGSTTGVSLLNNRPQFTVLGWFRPTGTQGATNGRVGLFGQNDVAELGYHDLDTIGIWTEYGGFATVDSSLVQTGQWHLIAATADGTNLRLYLDGKEVGRAGGVVTDYGASSSPFNIGYAVLDATGNNFLGDIDDVAVFDHALSLAELYAIFHAGMGTELKLTVEQEVQVVVEDSKPSGTPHHAMNHGAAWLASSTDTHSPPVTREGVMQFTSTERDQIVLPWDADFNTTQGTITFWIRSAGITAGGNEGAMIIDHRHPLGDVIVQDDLGVIFTQPNGLYNSHSTRTVSDGNWHHVAYVFNQALGATVSIYIDGVLDTVAPANPAAWSWSQQQIEIGLSWDPWWRVFNGELDDIRFYKRMLSPAEVAEIYAGDSALVGASDLAGRYNFNCPPGSAFILTWPIGVLESAPSPNGPWSVVTAAASPYEVLSPSGNRFYRLRL